MSYLRYLCLLVYSVVQHILCFCFVLLHLVYPMLPISLYCPFLIALSVLYNVYLLITKQGQLKVEYMGQTYTIRCQTTNSPIRAWNIYESSPFSRKKFLSLCSIVKTTEWNGLIKIDN